MYIWLMITWFFGSFLFSKSLDNDKPFIDQMTNVKVFPILLFMTYMVTAMLVVFTGTSNVDWNDPDLMFQWETFPFAIIGTYAFLIGDLMHSKVTWSIISQTGRGFASEISDLWKVLKKYLKSFFLYVYCEEDPAVLKMRAAEERRREMGW